MEVKERRGRAQAGKQTARPAVRQGTGSMLADGRPGGAAGWALAAVAALTVSGILPTLAAGALMPLVEAIPSAMAPVILSAAAIAALALVWREL